MSFPCTTALRVVRLGFLELPAGELRNGLNRDRFMHGLAAVGATFEYQRNRVRPVGLLLNAGISPRPAHCGSGRLFARALRYPLPNHLLPGLKMRCVFRIGFEPKRPTLTLRFACSTLGGQFPVDAREFPVAGGMRKGCKVADFAPGAGIIERPQPKFRSCAGVGYQIDSKLHARAEREFGASGACAYLEHPCRLQVVSASWRELHRNAGTEQITRRREFTHHEVNACRGGPIRSDKRPGGDGNGCAGGEGDLSGSGRVQTENHIRHIERICHRMNAFRVSCPPGPPSKEARRCGDAGD